MSGDRGGGHGTTRALSGLTRRLILWPLIAWAVWWAAYPAASWIGFQTGVGKAHVLVFLVLLLLTPGTLYGLVQALRARQLAWALLALVVLVAALGGFYMIVVPHGPIFIDPPPGAGIGLSRGEAGPRRELSG